MILGTIRSYSSCEAHHDDDDDHHRPEEDVEYEHEQAKGREHECSCGLDAGEEQEGKRELEQHGELQVDGLEFPWWEWTHVDPLRTTSTMRTRGMSMRGLMGTSTRGMEERRPQKLGRK